MIRRLAPPPASWNGRLPAPPPGALAVNQVGDDLAVYWDDGDPRALSVAAWQNWVTAANYQPPVEETTQATINGQLDLALDAMRAHVTRGTFTTAAQRDAALLLVLRVCIGLVRLARNRLDAPD